MNTQWFILNNGYHQGPFSEKELKELLNNKKIEASTQVWSEGIPNWITVAQLLKLDVKNTPKNDSVNAINRPKTKKLITKRTSVEEPASASNKAVKKVVSSSKVEVPPPIPLDALIEDLNLQDPKNDNHKANKKSSFDFSWSKYLLILTLVTSFCTILIWYGSSDQQNTQVRVKGVMPIYVDRLQEIVSMNSPTTVVGLALSLDGKSMVAAINKSGVIRSKFELTSIKGRVLGSNETQMAFEGYINNHTAEFKKISFVKGNQFYPGEYKMVFKGVKAHPLVDTFTVLRHIDFFKELTSTFDFETSVLLYQGTPKDFEKKIIEFNESLKEQKLAPYIQRAETLKTMYSILNKATEKFVSILFKNSKPKEIVKSFDGEFSSEISPILQTLVLAAIDENKKIEAQDIKNIEQFEFNKALIRIGVAVGELGTDMSLEVDALTTLTDMQKNKIRNKMEERYKQVKAIIVSEISKVDQDIKSIN